MVNLFMYSKFVSLNIKTSRSSLSNNLRAGDKTVKQETKKQTPCLSSRILQSMRKKYILKCNKQINKAMLYGNKN